MKKKWLELKKTLEKYHPYTRINYLKQLLGKVKDEEIKKDIEKEIEQALKETEGQKLWKKHGLPFTRKDEIDEEEKIIQEQEELEEIVEGEVKEVAGVSYSNVRDMYEDLGKLKERSVEGTLTGRERERLSEIREDLNEYGNVVSYGEVKKESRETFNRSEDLLDQIEKYQTN
jgi:hypothetical protein